MPGWFRVTTPRPLIALLVMILCFGACSEEPEGSGSSGPGDSVDIAATAGDVPVDGTSGAEMAEDVQGPGDTPEPQDGSTVADTASPDDSISDADALQEGGDSGGETSDSKPGFTVEVTATDTALPLGDGTDPSDAGDPPGPDASDEDATGAGDWEPGTLWLLTIDNTAKTLQKVNVETAETVNVCDLADGTDPGGLLGMPTYPSLTFSRFNGLYASRQGGSLDQIDPCTCEITPIGSYGEYSGIYGITSDQGENLFGVATIQDWLVAIATETGNGHGVGPLGSDFTTSGATWSDEDEILFAINGGTNGLYTIDPTTGAATLLSALNYDFGTVGIELHPSNGVIYACSSDAHLLSVGLDGQVTDIGDMNQGGTCTNLAAPWLPVPCLDDL